MVNYPVTELWGEDFSQYWEMGEETDGFSWHIATVKQLVVQFYEIVLRIFFKLQLGDGVPFILPRILVCSEEVIPKLPLLPTLLMLPSSLLR